MTDEIGSFFQSLGGINTRVLTPKVYSKKVLSNETKLKLLSYQEDNVVRLINILLAKHVALDGSDAGVGKTYMAMAICREMGRRPIVVCPKTIMYNWVTVAQYMGVKPYDVVNYETMKNGKTYSTREVKEGNKTRIIYKFKTRKRSPFLDLLVPDPDDPHKCLYEWKLPDDVILIVDEAHRCKDPSTENGKFLKSMKSLIKKKIPILLLSATVCEKVMDMRIPFYLFDFIPETRHFNHYCKSLDEKNPDLKVSKKPFINMPPEKRKEAYEKAKKDMEVIKVHREIKAFTSRIRIKDLGDRFPSNQWCAQLFNADDTDEITKAYVEIAKKMEELKKHPGGHHLAEIGRLKQEIELRKIPIFIEQAQELLDNGKSVIIFVNYLATLRILSTELNITCKIYGGKKKDELASSDDDVDAGDDVDSDVETNIDVCDKLDTNVEEESVDANITQAVLEKLPIQTLEQRQHAIELFQSNQEKIIICQMRAGSVGISLHDLDGNHPRAVLLNYPNTATDLIQAMGRAHRSGGKSPVLQRIVLVANVPYEERIKKNIDRKLANVSAINDGDLDGYKYKVLRNKMLINAEINN